MKIKNTHLTDCEKEIMNFFWAEDKSLTINNLSVLCNKTYNNYHLINIVKALIKKGFIKDNDIITRPKSYCINITFEEYASNQITNIISTNKNTFDITEFLSKLTNADNEIINHDDLEIWLESEKSNNMDL